MTTAQQLGTYRGPAIFKLGFRPFFLGGAVWAGAAMALFLPMLQGEIALPTAFSVLDWHIHGLLYGYLPAIVAGFPPNRGAELDRPLACHRGSACGFVRIWLAGRAAVASSGLTGPVFTAAVDLFLLIALGAIVGREIVAEELAQPERAGAGGAALGRQRRLPRRGGRLWRRGLRQAHRHRRGGSFDRTHRRAHRAVFQQELAREERAGKPARAFRQVRPRRHRDSGDCPGHLGCRPADRAGGGGLRVAGAVHPSAWRAGKDTAPSPSPWSRSSMPPTSLCQSAFS